MRKTFFCVLVAGFALASCNSGDSIEPERASQYDIDGALIVHVSIPAQIKNPESGIRFGDGREVYLINSDRLAVACDKYGKMQVLKQTRISADSLSCTLEGDVTFYHEDNTQDEIVLTPERRNVNSHFKMMLLYGWSQSSKGVEGLYCDYTRQDGSALQMLESRHAWTYLTLLNLKEGDEIVIQDTLKLRPVDSGLEIDMQFVDEDGTTPVEGIKVQSAVLSTQLDGLVREYRLSSIKRGSLRMGPIRGSKLYASINYGPELTYGRKSDVFTLTAVDSSTWDTYKASWTVNLDKFAGGLYTQELVMQKQPLLVQTLYRSPVTVYTPENGKYRLGDMGDVAVYNGGAADIEGYTVLNVHLFDARLDGQIKLMGEVSDHMALSSKIFSESSLINNPDGVAIKNAGEIPITIAEGSTLTIKGDIDGDLSLQPGSQVIVEGDIKGLIRMAVGSSMKVKGDVSNASFFATEGLIVDFTEYDPASDYRIKTGFTIYEARYPIGGR
ncbi:MAG: hypothetical protein J6W42_02030 [Bacteroidaceae bacterium]|nr:hypothetical protein [Bacteroidaceae bacterium]